MKGTILSTCEMHYLAYRPLKMANEASSSLEVHVAFLYVVFLDGVIYCQGILEDCGALVNAK
jgi:hypothetical protein